MPTTKKETVYFGLIMCFGMVLVMTVYNLYLNGMLGQMTLIEGFADLLIGFVIAFILDLYLVGPNAKRLALNLTANTEKPIYKVLTISVFMVLGMAFFMSIYGLITSYIHIEFSPSTIHTDYLSIYGKNLIVALPLQILVMGPLVRFIFMRYIKKQAYDRQL